MIHGGNKKRNRSLWHLLFVYLHFGRDFLSKHFKLKLWFTDYDFDKLFAIAKSLTYKPCNTVLVENYCTSLAHFEVFPQKVLFWPVKNSNERLLTCWNFNYSTFNITKFLVLGMQNSSYAAFMVMYLECWFHTCKKKQKRPYWGCSEKHRKIMSNCTAQEYD